MTGCLMMPNFSRIILSSQLMSFSNLFDSMTFAQAYECRFFADELCLLQPDEVRAVFDDDCLRHVSAWVNGGVDIGRTKDVTAGA